MNQHQNENHSTDKLKPMVYSMACSYSGHTLLAYFLDSHSRLTHLGDTIITKPNYREKMCSCNNPTNRCSFWQQVYAWDQFNYLRLYISSKHPASYIFNRPYFAIIQKLLLSVNMKLRLYAHTLANFRDLVCKINETDEFIYGRKQIADVLIPVLCGYPVKIIHITKHPYDYVASCLSRQKTGGMFSDQTVKDFIKYWIRYNNIVYSLQSFKSQYEYVHIKYEDLCRQPAQTLKKACSFLGVDYEPMMIEPNRFTHHLVGSRHIVKDTYKGIQTSTSRRNLISQSDKTIINKYLHSGDDIFGYDIEN